jgi:hypothetical protein
MNLGRQFGIENSFGAGISHNLNILTFLHELHTCDLILGNRDLLESLVVHEDVVLTLLVEVLVGTTLYAYILELLTDIETTLQNVTINNVLECGTHEGVTLTGLYVKEIDTEVQLTIHADAGTFLDVLSINHNFL